MASLRLERFCRIFITNNMALFTAPLSKEKAVDALIRSHNHVYRTAYRTHWEDLGGVSVSYYGNRVPGLAFQLEFLAYEQDPVVVIGRVNSYPRKPNEKLIINVFHDDPSDAELKKRYHDLGYDFVETAAILGLPLPTKTPRGWTHVHKIESVEEIEFANQGLAVGGEKIPPTTYGDPHIINFFAQLEHRAVGWTQLVTICDGIGYLNQLYTLPVFRQRGIGTRLLRRAHQEANHIGLKHMVLLASEMGMSLYRRAGYRPLTYLSVFKPEE